jgi:hypothetical protein
MVAGVRFELTTFGLPTLECRFWGASELTIRELIGSDNTGALSLPIL